MSTPNDAVVAEITEVLKSAESSVRGLPRLTVIGPFQTSIVRTDGMYRNKALEGGEELLLKGIRGGKRSEFIFEFEPVKPTPHYVRVEIEEKNMMHVGGLEPAVVQMLGFDPSTKDWQYAKKAFMKNAKKKIAVELEKAEQSIAEDKIRTYGSNPIWNKFS